MTGVGRHHRLILWVLLVGGPCGCGEVEGPSGTNGSSSATTVPFATAPRPAYTAIQGRWGDSTVVSGWEVFSTDQDHLLKDGEPFFIRGVVYVPGYPGYLPWEIETVSSLPEKLTKSIDRDIGDIAAMGANTVRFWGAPGPC